MNLGNNAHSAFLEHFSKVLTLLSLPGYLKADHRSVTKNTILWSANSNRLWIKNWFLYHLFIIQLAQPSVMAQTWLLMI